MKKIIAAVLSISFVVCMASCGRQNTSNKEKTTERTTVITHPAADGSAVQTTSQAIAVTNLSETETAVQTQAVPQTTEETTQKLNADGDIILDDTSKVEKYSVTPDEADAEQYSDYGAISAWKNRSTVKAPENTYCMHIGTGAAKGDTILYFEIMYTDMKNQSRTQFIFPSLDAQDKSDSILKYGANGKDINDTYGTQMLKQFNYGEQVANEKPLGDWTVQDYVFQTEAEIQNVDGIKFYLAQGSWTIQGLEIYKVDEYKGYEEYGMVSGKRFLDFKGRKIAAVVKTNSGTLTYSTSGADAVVEIGEDV